MEFISEHVESAKNVTVDILPEFRVFSDISVSWPVFSRTSKLIPRKPRIATHFDGRFLESKLKRDNMRSNTNQHSNSLSHVDPLFMVIKAKTGIHVPPIYCNILII